MEEMTIEDVKSLIASDESRTLELKKTTGELKDGMHSACAFLNTEGGWLIFGVTPNSLKIVGQQVTDNTQKEIAQALAGLEPAVDARVRYVDVPEYPGNKVIAIKFSGWVWGERPHTFHGCPYYKVESTTKVMPHDMYDERIRVNQLKAYSWESLTGEGVSIENLNEKHIKGCIRLGVDGGRIPGSALKAPLEDTLAKWSLLNNGVPTNGAVMLFSDKIDAYPNFRLRMARFFGVDKNEFMDSQLAEGNFFDLLDAGLAFCFKHLNLSGKITNKKLQREERLEIPYKALREVFINSLCHRQWEKHNLTNSVAIYDDRVEIANPGVFPPQITPETMPEPHQSYPYNLKVAEVLFRSTFLESWGSGAKRVIEACEEQGVEPPTWRMDGGFVTVTFRRPKKDPSTTDPTGVQLVANQYSTSEKAVQLLILKASNDFLSSKELANLCGIKDIRHFRKYYLNQAIKEGAIDRLYPDQVNHPKQKFRLSESAWEWKMNYALDSISVPSVLNQYTTGRDSSFNQYSTSTQTVISKAYDDFLSAKELAELCGIGEIRYFRKHYLNPAIAEGAVERMYPEQMNHPRQKYRLTEIALAWKKNQSHFSKG